MKLLPVLACLPLAAACVSLPEPQEMLDTGFRTPEMTFHTFQMAVRADLPRLEFRCLSADLQGQGGQLGYREFREKELEGRLEYWLGIPKAKITGSIPQGRDRHVLQASALGYDFEVEFVRESFWQVWHGDEHVVDEAIPRGSMRDYWALFEEEDGSVILATEARLPEELVGDKTLPQVAEPISEFRLGSEWKIAGFREAPSREAQAAPKKSRGTP